MSIGRASNLHSFFACFCAQLILFSGASVAAQLEVHVIGADGQPIENAVIYTDHFAQESTAQLQNKVLDQQDKTFIPHVMVVAQGTRIDFSNTDSVNHYVYSFSDAKKFQFKLFKSEKNPPSVIFDQAGLITLGCNIHDFMLGYILVTPNQHFSATNKDGLGKIQLPDNVQIKLRLWLERANENLDLLSQSLSIQNSDVSVQIKLKKSLKPERRVITHASDY